MSGSLSALIAAPRDAPHPRKAAVPHLGLLSAVRREPVPLLTWSAICATHLRTTLGGLIDMPTRERCWGAGEEIVDTARDYLNDLRAAMSALVPPDTEADRKVRFSRSPDSNRYALEVEYSIRLREELKRARVAAEFGEWPTVREALRQARVFLRSLVRALDVMDEPVEGVTLLPGWGGCLGLDAPS